MLQKIVLSSLLIFGFNFICHAQFKVESFANNSIKITYSPANYTTTENITNATILKPSVNVTKAYSISNNAIKVNQQIIKAFKKDSLHGLSISLQNNEEIYGGGERAIAMNRRGTTLMLYNNPWYGYGIGADALNFSVPFFLSNKGYAIFFDNGSKGFVDIGKSNPTEIQAWFSSGEINMFLIYGKNYQEILSNYHKLTGTQPLPPQWALGNLMSRFGYTSENQANEILGKMEKENIPVDAIIFDLFWFGDSIKGTLGNLDWVNKKAWPNPKQMMNNFKTKNINTVLIAEPFVLENTLNYNNTKKLFSIDKNNNPYTLQKFYFGKGGLLDIFKKETGNWIWNNHYKKQIANGAIGWWTDLGEPENHPEDLMHNAKDYGVKYNLPANSVHNIYGHYWNEMLFTNYQKELPNKRLFHLNRSGFAGSQRFSIFPWSGDVERSWKGLQAQLPVMLGMSICGVPYIHADAGGFAGGEKDAELYVRWLQFAAYTPIFRPHGTALYNIDPQATSYPSEPALFDEPYKSLAKKVVYNRYEMLPYNYTLAYNQTQFAEPLVTPMFYYFSHDSLAVKCEDQYMWGSQILVSPVIEKNARIKTTYLPKGKWFSTLTNQFIEGNNFVTNDVTNFKFPVFYKEGSFIPTYNCSGENTSTLKKENLKIHYIQSTEASSYTLFNDDGENSNSLKQREFQLIRFTSSGNTGNRINVRINATGKYKNMPSKRNIQLIIPALKNKPKQITINGKRMDFATTSGRINSNAFAIWSGDIGGEENNNLSIPLSLQSTTLNIEIKF